MKSKLLKTWNLKDTDSELSRQQAKDAMEERKAMKNEWYILISLIPAVCLLRC